MLPKTTVGIKQSSASCHFCVWFQTKHVNNVLNIRSFDLLVEWEQRNKSETLKLCSFSPICTLNRLPVRSGSLVQGGGADRTGKLSSTHIVSCRAGGVIVGHHGGAYRLQCPVRGVLVPVHARSQGEEDVQTGTHRWSVPLFTACSHLWFIVWKMSWEHFHPTNPAKEPPGGTAQHSVKSYIFFLSVKSSNK